MQFRPFGETGMIVSSVAMGTMNLFGSGAPGGVDDVESRRLISAFRDAGGNFFDTADVYGGGRVESCLGEVFRKDRDAVVLATKVGLNTDPENVNAGGNSRKAIRRGVERSLRRLETDHVDILWLHTRDPATPLALAIEALMDEVTAGRALHVGLSNWPAWEVAAGQTGRTASGSGGIAGIQLKYNLLDRDAEIELLPMAAALGLAVTAWAPLAGGVLTGKYSRDDRGAARFDELGRLPSRERVTTATAVARIAAEAGTTPTRLAIGWMLAQADGRVIPVVGARTTAQLQESTAATADELSSEVMTALTRLSPPALPYPHDFLDRQRLDGAVHGPRLRENAGAEASPRDPPARR